MSDNTVSLTIEDRVGRLTFGRPEAGNAFTSGMLQEFEAALGTAAEAADILVIRAAGPDFTLGRDRQEPKGNRGPFEAFRQIGAINDALANFPGITVAAVRGRAFGFGVGIVMRSDLAVAAEDARFSLDEVKLGIAPMFIMQEILQHLPAKRALDAVLTSREFSADEALAMGLLSRVVPAASLDQAVAEVVAELHSRDRRVLAACKRYLRTIGELPHAARSSYALVAQTQLALENH